jgi:hypothetical protein
MYLPMQRESVQRTLAGQPFANQPNGSAWAHSADPNRSDRSGIMPSGYGVQPSFSFGDLLPIITTVAGAFL